MEKIKKALKKKALGYSAKEITEEYSLDENGQLALTKKRISIKDYPPDVQALKTLIEMSSYKDELEGMSESQLIEERNNILKQIEKEK